MKRIFSGMQPSGEAHIGNYLGAIKHWVEGQNGRESLIFIADLHAITVPQDPDKLRTRTIELAKILLACGIDSEKTILFKQSDVPAHAELAWIMNCITSMGELSRMTQFKDKSQKGGGESASVGLFDYPVLQAADVLLYDIDEVPVGEDQKQHLELMRDLASRFNNRYGEVFKLPEPSIYPAGGRVLGLDNPGIKMSKSAGSNNYIALLDPADTIMQKIKRAVTDSGAEVTLDTNKPALYNLLSIYALFSGKALEVVGEEYSGKGYGQFKESLADLLIQELGKIQDRYSDISDEMVLGVLEKGKVKAYNLANKKLAQVKERVGLA